jgi:hypothetical protein
MRPLQLLILVGAVAGLARAVMKASRSTGLQSGGHGSLTTASDAVDDIEISANPHPEELLDAGVKETFPASDPVSVNNNYETAYEKEQRRQRSS